MKPTYPAHTRPFRVYTQVSDPSALYTRVHTVGRMRACNSLILHDEQVRQEWLFTCFDRTLQPMAETKN